LFHGQTRASFTATRLTPEWKSLGHLTRSRPSSEVAASSYGYQRLFPIVKRRPRRSCDILICAGVVAPEISVLAAPAGRTLTESRPEEPAQMRLIRKTHTQRYLTQG
jgi:gentisate 1,2-dioxygenase